MALSVSRVSPLTRTVNTLVLDITQEQYEHWKTSGIPIQDIMPNLTADDREFLITGLLAAEWDSLFGDA